MIPIQKLPPGLLSTFAIKGTGENPTALDQAYRATVDASQMLMADALQLLTVTSAAVNANDSGPSIVIASGETWYLRGLSWTASNGAAAVVEMRLILRPQGSAGGVVLNPYSMPRTLAAAQAQTEGVFFPEGLVVQPGTLIAALTNRAPGAAFDCSLVALYHRLQT